MAPAKTAKAKVDLSQPPKRGQTPYFLYAATVRQEIVKANPGIKVTEVAKLIGQKWKEVDAKEKEKFAKLAAKDKERYEKEKEAFVKAGGDLKAKPAKKAASKKAAAKEESESAESSSE